MRFSHVSASESDERLFLLIVETGSLKAAAERIGADPSAVSRRLAALESRLGQQLIRRSRRGSSPTDVGRRYYDGLAPLVAQQDALEAAVTGETDEPRGLLRVTAPPEFGVRFVVPVLEGLERKHGELSIQLALGSSFYDLEGGGLDAAVRIGHLSDSALRVRRLGNVPRTMVAAPDYLDRRGRPGAAPDLKGHRFLGYRTTDGRGRFSLITAEGQRREVTVHLSFTVDSISTLVRLTEAGDGIVLGPQWAFAQGLAAGRLERVLPDVGFDAPPVQVLYAGHRYLPARTRAFIEAMTAAVAAEPNLESG
ncbi:MAG: LysR family transcriptional regulator [Myxococcota bacterium]